MAGENHYAADLINRALQTADDSADYSREAMGRALLNAVLQGILQDRSAADLASELHYLADNLGEDEFVITRGC